MRSRQGFIKHPLKPTGTDADNLYTQHLRLGLPHGRLLAEIKREQQKRSLELRLKEIAIEHGINSTSEYKIVTSKFIENSK